MESAELIAILNEVRDRVRAQNPDTAISLGEPKGPRIALPDLLPLVHARDAALGKVAAIGTVNPRAGGPVNWLVQSWKRLVSRVLDWHVREQVEFNRKTITAIDAAIEAFNATNRAMAELAGTTSRALSEMSGRLTIADELKDIRDHWIEWRLEWERKLAANEVQFLRSVADLQAGFQHRVDLMDANHRDLMREQHKDFHGELDRRGIDIQQRLWADLEKMKVEFERLIHAELHLIRQRATAPPGRVSETQGQAPSAYPTNEPLAFDYGRFAERFRGTEEYVKAGQQIYLSYFSGRGSVLDIGCGRGEFLEMMRQANVPARGIDLSEESVTLCRQKGLEAEAADLFQYLTAQPEAAFDGIFCSQVVEHLDPARLPELIRLAASRLERNGVLAIETPNPECLAIFATHFYLDPTHTRPVPHPLLAFYMEEFGLGGLEVRKLSPAVETMPALAELPAGFRDAFFGGLDYAIIGKKL
ncbi:MAG TPA: class I SAM-dependent methyltransferase [Bryobacteraceae bacterium]|nr:class I SAM-dependent methyltransferase [Bryobacteraceae bacterium]